MPIPLLALLTGAAVGKAVSKEEHKIPVNGRVKIDGERSKAHLRKKKAR